LNFSVAFAFLATEGLGEGEEGGEGRLGLGEETAERQFEEQSEELSQEPCLNFAFDGVLLLLEVWSSASEARNTERGKGLLQT
jgi:hypothetical protein